MEQNKVVLISSGQPALNPRLVKEADALSEAGYNVTVIYAYWNAWGAEFTQQLLAKKKWQAICAGGHPHDEPGTYLLSRLIFKFSRQAFSKLGIKADSAIARCTPFLIREAKKHKADLYIAHNLGALPAAVKAAKKYNAKCAFDAEDFHRMEVTDNKHSLNYKISKATEDWYFPKLDYISVSSPEIAKVYKELYPDRTFTVILNVFDRPSEIITPRTGDKVKLFWFSQTIGRQRGLEDIITALNRLSVNNYELHLLGNASKDDELYFSHLATRPFIHFHPPVHPDEVIVFGAQFDIGLALEPGFSTNNKKALSNKLFSYLQSGLAIIATETEAQRNFLETNQEIGYTYKSGDVTNLRSILNQIVEKPDLIKKMQQQSFRAGGEKYNWKIESGKLLKLVNYTIVGN